MSYETDTADLDLISAYRRLDGAVDALAADQGTAIVATIRLDALALDRGHKAYNVHLCGGKGEAVVWLDHVTFTDTDELFTEFVVPQLEAAIAKLGAP